MSRLRVVAGTSLDDLHPITVNTDAPHSFSSEVFEGSILAHIKDFPGPNGEPLESEYFDREDRKGVTWSIQVQGRFLRPVSTDDILFGNTFDRPLRLPWGASAAFRFMKYVDPTLEHDLASKSKPWALSPLLSTMPHLAHAQIKDGEELPPFPPASSLEDDVSQLHLAVRPNAISPASSSSSSPSGSSESLASSTSSHATSYDFEAEDKGTVHHRMSKLSIGSARGLKARMRKTRKHDAVNDESTLVKGIKDISGARQRRAFFADADHRREVILGPQDVITTDFCYGFMQFAPSISLQLPGGVSFDLMRYWDGQPVRFVCCQRKRGSESDSEDDTPWGRVFWCVAIELVEDEVDSSSA